MDDGVRIAASLHPPTSDIPQPRPLEALSYWKDDLISSHADVSAACLVDLRGTDPGERIAAPPPSLTERTDSEDSRHGSHRPSPHLDLAAWFHATLRPETWPGTAPETTQRTKTCPGGGTGVGDFNSEITVTAWEGETVVAKRAWTRSIARHLA